MFSEVPATNRKGDFSNTLTPQTSYPKPAVRTASRGHLDPEFKLMLHPEPTCMKQPRFAVRA